MYDGMMESRRDDASMYDDDAMGFWCFFLGLEDSAGAELTYICIFFSI